MCDMGKLEYVGFEIVAGICFYIYKCSFCGQEKRVKVG